MYVFNCFFLYIFFQLEIETWLWILCFGIYFWWKEWFFFFAWIGRGMNNFKYVSIAFDVLLCSLLARSCSWCSNCSILSAWNAYIPSTWTNDCLASICYASTRGSPFFAITCYSISYWAFSLNTCNGFPPTVAEPTGPDKWNHFYCSYCFESILLW